MHFAIFAAEVNDKLTQVINQVSPDLGGIFKAATQPTSDVLRSFAQNRQDTMQQYFKNQNYRQVSVALLQLVSDVGECHNTSYSKHPGCVYQDDV